MRVLANIHRLSKNNVPGKHVVTKIQLTLDFLLEVAGFCQFIIPKSTINLSGQISHI